MAAFWAVEKTSRGDVVPTTCSVPSTPRSIIRVDGLKHRFGRSGLALRNAELRECCRPLGPRDGKGFNVELHDFTQLRSDFIRAHHRTEFDDPMPRPRRPAQKRCDLGADVVGRDHGRFPICRVVVDGQRAAVGDVQAVKEVFENPPARTYAIGNVRSQKPRSRSDRAVIIPSPLVLFAPIDESATTRGAGALVSAST